MASGNDAAPKIKTGDQEEGFEKVTRRKPGHKTKIEEEKSEGEHVLQKSDNSSSTGGQSRSKAELKCSLCKKTGHFRRSCPARGEKKKPGEGTKRKREGSPTGETPKGKKVATSGAKRYPKATIPNAWDVQKLYIRNLDGTPVSQEVNESIALQFETLLATKEEVNITVVKWTWSMEVLEVTVKTKVEADLFRANVKGFLCQTEEEWDKIKEHRVYFTGLVSKVSVKLGVDKLGIIIQKMKTKLGIPGMLRLKRLLNVTENGNGIIELEVDQVAMEKWSQQEFTMPIGTNGLVKFWQKQSQKPDEKLKAKIVNNKRELERLNKAREDCLKEGEILDQEQKSMEVERQMDKFTMREEETPTANIKSSGEEKGDEVAKRGRAAGGNTTKQPLGHSTSNPDP